MTTEQETKLGDALEEIGVALSMLACPAYSDEGTCRSGCYSEPSCRTDEPVEGWLGFAGAALTEALALVSEGVR